MTQQPAADIGVTGLAVMGRNLARNLARHGHAVALHNRSAERAHTLAREHGDEGTFVPSETMAGFVASLRRPRVVIIMVKAGAGTDAVIDELVPLLEEGDIVVDCGNSQYTDTRRREAALRDHGEVLLALLRIKARHPKRRVRGCKYLALSHEWAGMAHNVPLAGVSHFFLQAAEACGITGGN